MMKKIFALLFLVSALSACYDDYVNDYDFDSVCFPYQINARTFVVGEDMKIQIGVALSGVRENDRDRTVAYQIDNSLVNSGTLTAMQGAAPYIKSAVATVTELKLLPADYYTVTDNNQFVIKKGQHSGTIMLRPDSAKFLADAQTLVATYVLPLRITSADADSILVTKNYAVIGLKYENMLFGNYVHGGVTVVKDIAGIPIDTLIYFTTVPSPDSKAWILKTVGPLALVTNGVSDIASSSKNELKITLSGGTITVNSVVGATYQVEPDGASTYNQAKLLQNRKIFLNYKYQNAAGDWCYAKDTLTFRNRIRDGVNEWQDENPANYK